MRNIKQMMRYIAFLLLVGCATSATGAGLVVGNKVEGPKGNIWKSAGPSEDFTFQYTNSFSQVIAVHKETSLRKVAVFNWSGEQSAGAVYCDKNDKNPLGIRLFHNYISSGKNADGHRLWKTNVTGLYFAMELTTLRTAGASNKPQWLDNDPGTAGAKSTGLVYDSGATACTHDYYYLLGGLQVGLKIHLYADSSFIPSTSADGDKFQLSKTGGHGAVDFYLSNDQATYAQSRYKANIIIPATGLKLQWPTCKEATVSGIGGTQVKDTNQVQLGSYQPKQIKAGLAPAKFSIDMDNCIYIHNIEVKLATTKVGKNNTELLGNQETSDAASGVGVLIEGLKSNASAQMKLLPNNSSSIYKDIINDPYTESTEGVKDYKLYFQATLQQDGNDDITPGKFRARGTFQITYP
ncbi:TPA: fimbrial protein [Salmonella enterica subsp. enterica serovar Vietnam]|uniref:Fimbrial-type adhesion domain-containing protein n=1 Tax=Salmonella enterica subsp. arizonae TaxID=59203 RepID=A0A5Y2QMK9_SALER|nr:fimbrial protein [Salmonella enterica]ECF4923584.1 hypothetical protein [Salmonella enterica subsp. arizonae]ECI9859245.1 hypothetical protein [Salmonella enterica subsp. arizonae]